jgi:hypothetical protein
MALLGKGPRRQPFHSRDLSIETARIVSSTAFERSIGVESRRKHRQYTLDFFIGGAALAPVKISKELRKSSQPQPKRPQQREVPRSVDCKIHFARLPSSFLEYY